MAEPPPTGRARRNIRGVPDDRSGIGAPGGMGEVFKLQDLKLDPHRGLRRS